MAARSPIAPSENWDDDFVFQRAKDLSNVPRSDSDELRWSMSTCRDWRGDTLPTRNSTSPLSDLDPQLPIKRLKEWAEPGPSTPPKHAVAPTENWDDDFEDKTDSPARHPPSRPHHKAPKLPGIPEPENWDDDLDSNKFVSPRKYQAWDSSDEEDAADFVDQEEDKTVTARSRKVALAKSSPPQLPPLPLLPLSVGEAFPGSPTTSVFSLPSGRDSATYSSLAHLPLRGGSASALAVLPSSPPTQKARRRLRKKSRPPDSNVFELLDRQQVTSPLPSPPQPSSPNPEAIDLPSSETSNSSRTSILSRIGSVTRWGVRKRRTSPSPGHADESAEAGRDATPRAAASQATSPSRTPSWFFRSSDTPDSTPGSPLGSATLELKHERSLRHLGAYAALHSPTKRGKIRGAILGERSHDSGSSSTVEGSPPSSPRRPRRPTSMQVPAMTPPPHFPRHASYGAPSTSHSTSHTSIEDVDRQSESKGQGNGGHRSFMSGVRRMSLVSGKRHRRTKSTATAEQSPYPPIPQIPPSTITLTPSNSSQLLPPIELQPPSPPREQDPDEPRKSIASERSLASTSESLAAGVESLLLQPSIGIRSLPSPPTIAARPSPTKSPGSPQPASLGRTTQLPPASSATGIVPRRNSLGDLKIPSRISQAQVGLKRDLGMVREFAAEVEKLKELQTIYQSLAVEAQTVLLEPTRHPPRATSPTFFNLPRPRSRARSNTSPNSSLEVADSHKQISALFSYLDHKYKISWECAELLIELGGGPPAPTPQPHTSSPASAQQFIHPFDSISGRKSRERAITLAGDESVPPLPMSFSGPSVTSPPGEWRASTGRNDLSQRQLWLLRDMLNMSDSSPTMLATLQIPEEGPINRSWRWGEAMSSTITLPSEGSIRNSSPAKKRRYSRLGMSGLRDMLRSLTRGHQHGQPPIPFRPSSSASTSASSSYDDQSIHAHSQRRLPRSGTGPEGTPSLRASSPFSTAPALSHKSPRRPSIASIFRFAQRVKISPPGGTGSKHRDPTHPILHSYGSGSDLGNRNGTVDDDEDWDHLDSAEDLDAAARALGLKDLNGTATVRHHRTKQHPYQSEREQKAPSMKKGTSASASQSSLSLWAESPSTGSRSQVSLSPTAAPIQTTSPPHPPLPATAAPQSMYMRPTRLSNVEEMAEAQLDNNQSLQPESRADAPAGRAEGKSKSKSPRRRSSRRGGLTGSVRSAPPPTPLLQDGDRRSLALSLTPETIRPLLENARDVHAKCTECVDELRTLLAAQSS
ncbi:hypothetical protein BJV78DRAFT_896701 [Lactifluus subvellereus]|nr:hypothetical protein BJV78DRAFT_896701 [Lactifluus subvellereus]